MSKSTLKSILNVSGSQCKSMRTGVICSDFQVLVRILAAAFWTSCQLSSSFLYNAGEETISITHPTGDKGINKFLQVHQCIGRGSQWGCSHLEIRLGKSGYQHS